MIGKRDEYERMFALEERLWWYRILHEQVLAAIQRQFADKQTLAILDAGCGTGGLLTFLSRAGYTQLQGVDGSTDAVAFCQERGLSVSLVNLTKLADYQTGKQFDVVVCNDVFCYFDDPTLIHLLTELGRRLTPNGLLISNNNAFAVFRGQHDLAVGSIRRFRQTDFDTLAPKAGLQIQSSTYWSLALSPLILAIRQWQNWQLRLGWRKADASVSDVYFPGEWVNTILYRVVRTEQALLPKAPFGSSLFLTMSAS